MDITSHTVTDSGRNKQTLLIPSKIHIVNNYHNREQSECNEDQQYRYAFPYNMNVNMSATSELPNVMPKPRVKTPDFESFHSPTFIFMGNMQFVTDFLDQYSFSDVAFPAKVLNGLLRSFGAPLLVNNPISGILIMIAIGFENILPLLIALGCMLVATLISATMCHPKAYFSNGYSTEQALLLGITVSFMWPCFNSQIEIVILFLIILSSLRLVSNEFSSKNILVGIRIQLTI